MSTPVPSIEVLEHCLKNPIKRPVEKLLEPSYNCCRNISKELVELIESLLTPFLRFPDMTKLIRKLTTKIINKHVDLTNKRIQELMIIEENYVWTDNPKFREDLSNLFMNHSNENKSIIDKMHNLLKTYYNTIIMNFKNNVPKIVMYFLITKIQEELTNEFYKDITNYDYHKLLTEESNIHQKRKMLREKINKLTIAKNLIQEVEE